MSKNEKIVKANIDGKEQEVTLSFEPGCFDDFEGTQEDLEEFLEELTKQIASGEFFENADTFDVDELEIQDIICEANENRKLH
jgi:hypothetical protein